MARSSYVKERDVRSILRLVGELFELPDDPTARSIHLVDGACRMFGARSGLVGVLEGKSADGAPIFRFGAAGGWLDERTTQLYEVYANDAHMRDPMLVRLMKQTRFTGVFQRGQVVPNPDWYRSLHFNEMRIPLGIDDAIYTFHPLGPGKQMTGLGINRELGGGAFSKRENKLISLLHEALTPFYHYLNGRLQSPAAVQFPPMMDRVLRLLLAGKSEKQVAAELQRSRHTIHDHVKIIYRRLGVGTRAELLARCMNPAPTRPRSVSNRSTQSS